MPFKYMHHVFENITKNEAFVQANAPFSRIFSKVFKTLLKFFHDRFDSSVGRGSTIGAGGCGFESHGHTIPKV